MSGKSFLDRAAEYTYQELERLGNDPSKLDVPQRTVAILYSIQAIIDNGGFQYLFENDLPYLLPYMTVSDAYRRIGAAHAAERLDKAVSIFSSRTLRSIMRRDSSLWSRSTNIMSFSHWGTKSAAMKPSGRR